MTAPDTAAFRRAYATALRAHLAGRGQATLAIGHELGRQALAEGVSILDITECHFRTQHTNDAAGLEFLLQTLAALDVATRGFLDGNRRFQQARDTALALQRAMLGPIDLPPAFAVRYEPAVPPLEIGGDWYDVVALDGGRWGLIVGDCVGSGLSAAAVMGQIRSAARALLLHGASPGEVLDGLDAVADRIDGGLCTTVCTAIVDPGAGTLRYSSAGHMPGIVADGSVVSSGPQATANGVVSSSPQATANGVVSSGPQATANGVVSSSPQATANGEALLYGGRSVPLATGVPGPRPEAQRQLPPGAVLLLFTDGLVERPGVDLDAAFSQVADLLADTAELRPTLLADTLLTRLAPPEGYDDDVAMLVYRQPPAPLRLEVAATPESLAVVRARLRSWLELASMDDAGCADVVAAVNEACTNSIEHGYQHTPGSVTVSAQAGISGITVTVTDTGVWRQPADPGDRGRGLQMIRALAPGAEVSSGPEGTTVVMRFPLPVRAFPARRH